MNLISLRQVRSSRITNQLQDLLEIGLKKPLRIRHEYVATGSDVCRLIYISDIHLRHGRSEHLSRQVFDAVRTNKSDAVLLGGDLVDSISELRSLSRLVHRLAGFAPVLAIGGNHDRRVGFDRVAEAVQDAGGQWIHDTSQLVWHGTRRICVSGPECVAASGGDVRILCGHNPRIWKQARTQGYDLVLSGHLHGCQVVAFEYRNRLFPGAAFYPFCYLNEQSGKTRLVVSRGVSDLIPIRWRCPREIVMCYV